MGSLNYMPAHTVLVTGGAGFIGSHLVEALLNDSEQAYQVVVIDNYDPFYSPRIKRANIAKHLSNPNFAFYEVDIRDISALQEIFSTHKFDTVVHLAARAGVQPSIHCPQDYLDTNLTGTLNLLECAKDHKVGQFVFGSSSSVYGLDAELPFSEDDKSSAPISPYAVTKRSAELLCHTYAHLYNIRCVCLRFFTVYGPRQRPDLAIHKFARLIYEGHPIPIYGDGSAKRDFTYVDDIIQGVHEAMKYKKTKFEIINLGESQCIRLDDLITLIEKAVGKPAIRDWRNALPGDMSATFADISKAERLLGYKPTTKIQHGIPKFVDWFMQHHPGDKHAEILN